MSNRYAKLLLTDEQLESFVKDQARWVADCVSDGTHDSWAPHLAVMTICEGKDEPQFEMVAFLIPFNTDQEKAEALRRVGINFVRKRSIPIAAVLTCEVWFSVHPLKGMQPKDDPFRKEALLVIGQTIQHAVRAQRAFFQRVNGNIVASDFEELGIRMQFPLLRHFWNGCREAMEKQPQFPDHSVLVARRDLELAMGELPDGDGDGIRTAVERSAVLLGACATRSHE